jgi:hypothetical protein
MMRNIHTTVNTYIHKKVRRDGIWRMLEDKLSGDLFSASAEFMKGHIDRCSFGARTPFKEAQRQGVKQVYGTL